jgi:ABC-type transporter Mla maintaining outer membrane lipid asymmetry ATPase subunit MlaF/ABC-type transporter Mla maintaining outer membrane lipid asymmetry permease subunit MlaE
MPAELEVPVQSSPGTAVELRDLRVLAGGRVLLERAAARFEPGQITLIVGPSGAGKSLLLRVLAGLITSQDQDIQVRGRVLFDQQDVLPQRGRVSAGVVFQNFALFDELTPLDNVRFAHAHRTNHRAAAGDSSPEALLNELRVPQNVRTASLSGGQRQRLAIARTLAYDPDVILYDEPTSGLDAATAEQVAGLIAATHETHRKTSIIVTHDYEALAPIADAIYLLDPLARELRPVPKNQWADLRRQLHTGPLEDEPPLDASDWAAARRAAGDLLARLGDFFSGTSRVVEEALLTPLRLLPVWRSPAWGWRVSWNYLKLVADPSAWLYLMISGAIIGFVATYFTFRFLPYAKYTEPLLIENLLASLGFALYRILVPVLALILIAARCGAAVASDVGGKSYGQQLDALRSLGVRPARYLLTGILYAFLIGAPLLVAIGYATATVTSLVVFTAIRPERGPDFWNLHYHRDLLVPGEVLYQGTHWLLAKVLLCGLGIAMVAYHRSARPKYSSRDVSAGITSTILGSTLWVLVVNFAFAFFEFD